MKTDWKHLDQYRRAVSGPSTHPGETFGEFVIPAGHARKLFIIATDGAGITPAWEHVSVSAWLMRGIHRPPKPVMPTWEDMSRVKDLFWKPEETAMQLHVPDAQHISHVTNCLHIWRPAGAEIPLPPLIFVGPAGMDDPRQFVPEL